MAKVQAASAADRFLGANQMKWHGPTSSRRQSEHDLMPKMLEVTKNQSAKCRTAQETDYQVEIMR